MNQRIVWNYIGKILALSSVCMLPSLFIAVYKREYSSLNGFVIAILAQLILGILLLSLVNVKDQKMYAREGFVIVAISWIIISLFGAIPMCVSKAIPSYLDAVFETVSGFTTTGSSILTNIEILPMSMLFWRSFTHWIGGMGVLVLLLAIAPSGRGSGMPLHILRAESPGPNVGKLAPKLYLTARILYLMYIVLTVAEIAFLLFGGMPLFDSLTISFGTAGTGGFSIKNDSIASYSTYCQTVIGVFMLLFGVNFNIYFLVIMGNIKSVFKNTELRVYLITVALATAFIAVSIKLSGFFASWGDAFHQSFFQVASIITTTGFATADFNLWPLFTHVILLILMAIGACAGSTGGGIKVSRIVIMFKSAKAEMKKLIHPKAVVAVTSEDKPLEKGTAERCFTFLFVYTIIIALSVLILSLEQGHGFKTNFSAVMATLNNIGPGFDLVGPTGNYAFFSPLSKVVLIADMLLGRLELFPLILTFLPSTWKRSNF